MNTAREDARKPTRIAWRRLTHRYTWAIVLITLLVVTLLLGAVVPQTEQVTQAHFADWQAEHPLLNTIGTALGLEDLITSWWILLLSALMVLLLGYDYTIRLRGITRSGKKASKQTFKTRMGIYGSLFFHLCLITIFAGAVIDLTFGFHGTVFLSEGQAERELPETYAYVKNGLVGEGAHKGFTFRMVRYDSTYAGYGMPTHAVLMRFYLDGNIAGEQWVAVNHPASVDGVRVYLRDEIGYTPHFEIYDTAGLPVYRHFVRLAARQSSAGIVHGDYIPLRNNDHELYCGVEPDSSNGIKLKFLVETPESMASTHLTPPGEVHLSAFSITVSEVRRWARFELSCHPGEPVVFAGLWGAILGLLWRFAFPQPRPGGDES